MKVVIVFNHPYDGSFCNAILQAVISGLQKANHDVDLIHLDKENFNPVMTAQDLQAFVNRQPIDPKVIEYKARLEKADHLVFIFPIWWELMPSMTKGFIDKVVFPGVAYDYKPNGFMVKRFTNLKGITMITTMNMHWIAYKLVFANAIKRAFFTGVFWKMGYKNRKWICFSLVKSVSDKTRKKWLKQIELRFAERMVK